MREADDTDAQCSKSAERCHTNIVYDDRQRKHAATEFVCVQTAYTKLSTWLLYRHDPPPLGSDSSSAMPGAVVSIIAPVLGLCVALLCGAFMIML